ncbi:hypothetical protein [Candidatus Absconditicoccus praedator]|uniref:hypothetical protein n=1 Tax=Candidatus Absconditicoccus praedator TaxID=2735562 RepID=UPI001E2FB529|nr:hypothetical protein [Candidatus Absconditicoccus praedator]UFX82715.1 hypothetical protein HLG78_01005 [Candidatus Absconditicoccus praedator]
MENSVLLAQIIGPIALVIGISLLSGQMKYKELVKDLEKSPLSTYIGALFAYVVGALIVANHNLWEMSVYVLITIFGYIGIAKGVALVLFPKTMIKFTNYLLKCNYLGIIGGSFYLIIGVALIYGGFFA